ncbi:ArsR/SmtB family transcription factor [Citricoccus sp. GCM10030269]|uniref:ArsR/SmtB family transcription factor n=1 Tax=Citricoccus sp. GCM10030269 TaxID=3273388 RepID=UPI00361B5D12
MAMNLESTVDTDTDAAAQRWPTAEATTPLTGLTSVGDLHATLFHALSEPTRLTLLQHLSNGEHRVRDLVEHLHLAQSTVSKHLACLRDCGVVTVRSEGRSSWFSIADPAGLNHLILSANAVLSASARTPSLRAHRESLAEQATELATEQATEEAP